MTKKKRLIKKLALLFASLLILFCITEIAARVYLKHFASDARFQRYATTAQIAARLSESDATYYRPHHYLGYVLGENYASAVNRHNSLGFRGEDIELKKPPGEFRIACLGGSTTYTTGVYDYRESFPYLLERELIAAGYDHVRVINAGTPNYSSFETLLNYQLRIDSLEPDLIIVYHGVNELKTRYVWPPEKYKRDNSGYRAPRLIYDDGSDWPESTAWRILSIRLGWRSPSGGPEGFYFQKPDSHPRVREKIHRTQDTEWYNEVRQALAANPPVYFRRNIENLVALAESHGVQVVLVTFVHSEFPIGPALAPAEAEFDAALDDQNQQLRDICLGTDAILYDFAAEFPRDVEYFVGRTHVNAAGAALKAKKHAAFIIEQELIPGP